MKGLLMKYFVLKPRGDNEHAKASRAAMRRYAKVIASSEPQLAKDLTEWADTEFANAYCESIDAVQALSESRREEEA
jgi:hypothetical protein